MLVKAPFLFNFVEELYSKMGKPNNFLHKPNTTSNMKINIQTICIVVFTFFFWNCKKRSHDTRSDDVIQIKLSTEGLEYVQLTPGKYFIYKDSANGKLDSVVVTKSSVENIFTPAGTWTFGTYAAYNAEALSLTLTKFDAGIQTIWGIDFRGLTALCCPSISMDNHPVEIHDTSGVLSFSYPVCNCYASTAIQGLTVEGKLYNNVIQTIGDNGADPSNPDYRRAVTYWAKGVGIIKRTKTTGSDTKTYFLVRNN